MTATFLHAPHQIVRYVRPFRWAWEVTDGWAGPILIDGRGKPLAGHRWTKGGAQLDAAIAAGLCKPSPRLVLEQRLTSVVARLDRADLRVEFRIDERDRVCVRPLCPCSTRDRVLIAREFLAVAAKVALACPDHETLLLSCDSCCGFAGLAAAGGDDRG